MGCQGISACSLSGVNNSDDGPTACPAPAEWSRVPCLRVPATPGGTGIRPFVDASYAGHSVVIADYHPGQSLVETLRDNGADRAVLTGREPLTEDMKELAAGQLFGLCRGSGCGRRTRSAFHRVLQTLYNTGCGFSALPIEGT
jgi:hypothetical protein